MTYFAREAAYRVNPSLYTPRGGFKLHSYNEFAGLESNVSMTFPSAPATALGVEILLKQPSIDLRAAAEIVLGDVGATLAVFRQVVEEYGALPEGSCRMVECLSALEASDWLSAITRSAFQGNSANQAIERIREHSRCIARMAKLVSGSAEDLSSEDAYLVGLLHNVCYRSVFALDAETPLHGHAEITVDKEAVPPFVWDALSQAGDEGVSGAWKYVLQAAHKMAEGNTARTV